jgi:hypothetical protein
MACFLKLKLPLLTTIILLFAFMGSLLFEKYVFVVSQPRILTVIDQLLKIASRVPERGEKITDWDIS